VSAPPVYRLLGKQGLSTAEFPPVETNLADGEIAFRQHTAGHTAGPNWPFFLNWVARYFRSADAAPGERECKQFARPVFQTTWAEFVPALGAGPSRAIERGQGRTARGLAWPRSGAATKCGNPAFSWSFS
jgi:hypothetical protein